MRERLALTQMLFVEGNHLCPACEKSGNCQLQAVAYHLGMMSPHYNHFYPQREVGRFPSRRDARPQPLHFLRALRARQPRGGRQERVRPFRARDDNHLVVNSASGQLGDTDLAVTDKAAQVCPTGAILIKRQGFAVPIGQRTYDQEADRRDGRSQGRVVP